MRKTFKGRLTLKPTKEKPKMPRPIEAEINVSVIEIDGVYSIDFECPNCKICFGFPIHTLKHIVKETEKLEKHSPPHGVI